MILSQERSKIGPHITRRRFLADASASVAGVTLLQSELVRGSDANSKISVGLIGCGNRGQWMAGLFQQHGGYTVSAVADYFEDKTSSAGEKLNVPAASRFTGLSGYHRLLEQKLDAVIIESPPYFHPEQAAAAIDAGKHVYLAKPVAVDVPGCMTIAESGKKATEKRLCFLVDFQTRANPFYQEAAQRVHDGEIGKIVSVEANYQAGEAWGGVDRQLAKDPHNPEMRLRAWGVDRTLSGDIITEQNIHAVDVACWMLDAHPLRAYGTGGRTRQSAGDCWDHFAVIFYYPNDIVVSFNSHQSGYGYDDILCRVYGLKGTVDTHYFGNVLIKATDFHSDHNVGDLYVEGVKTNIATFHDNVTKGDCGNPTVTASVRSNLTTILGRMAAYTNTVVTWDDMIRANKKLVADLKGLRV